MTPEHTQRLEALEAHNRTASHDSRLWVEEYVKAILLARELHDKLEVAVEALKYYSSPENHAPCEAFRMPISDRYLNQVQMVDRGQRANAALATITKQKP